MRRTVLLMLVGLAAALGVASAPLGAHATSVTLSVTSGNLDLGLACTATTCTAAQQKFNLPAAHPVTGTITLDDVADTIAFSFTVSSATFLDIAGAFLGVDEIQFTGVPGVTYAGTLTGVTFTATTVSWGPQNVATVAGSYTQLLASSVVAGPTAFSLPGVRVNGVSNCPFSFSSATLTNCGFPFAGNAFQLSVGSPTGQTLWFRETMNLNAVPEPGALGLLAMGLAGLALHSRRRM